jgi:SOS-response transcriptional repressor LexA
VNEEMIVLFVITTGIASVTSLMAVVISYAKSQTKRKISVLQPSEKSDAVSSLPIVGDIAAGLGRIAVSDIVDHMSLDDNHRNHADFGVIVEGNSMAGDGIFTGDIALIRQQASVERGEIAAVVIGLPKTGALGTLKRYYVYVERTDMNHWFLESSNPRSEHLVVVPQGVNIEPIRRMYTREIEEGRVMLYEDAELSIAGKYVGLVRTTYQQSRPEPYAVTKSDL